MSFGGTYRSLWQEIPALSQGLSLACLFIKDASFALQAACRVQHTVMPVPCRDVRRSNVHHDR
jgi:hypothetical protein